MSHVASCAYAFLTKKSQHRKWEWYGFMLRLPNLHTVGLFRSACECFSPAAISKKAFTFFRLFFNSIWKETRQVVFFFLFVSHRFIDAEAFTSFSNKNNNKHCYMTFPPLVCVDFTTYTGPEPKSWSQKSFTCCSSVVRIFTNVNGMMVLNRVFKLSFERSWRGTLRHSHIEAEINHLNY